MRSLLAAPEGFGEVANKSPRSLTGHPETKVRVGAVVVTYLGKLQES